ncbi:peptidoglycan-binding domain-containing protein [Microbacterium sp.]|uniref:peptidoglycan-binding domain-containing protein n=1 Tax=Microbacterium sp. TaxID=51671 RepID=UPI003A8AC6EC
MAVAAILVAGGWFASTLFVSPEQREAAAAPPAPEAVLAPVERGVLAESVTISVTSGRTNVGSYPLPTGAGAINVVTARTVKLGAEVSTGDVVSEVNGRPVMVIEGVFPFFRDLGVGDSGTDVRQLQRALAGAGYDIRETGELGQADAYAMAEMYRKVDYAPPSEGLLALSETIVSPVPSVVVAAPAVGTAVDGSVGVTLGSGELVGRASVPPAFASKLSEGLEGVIYGTDTVVEIMRVVVAGATENEADADLPGNSASSNLDQTADPEVIVRMIFPEGTTEGTVEFETDRVADSALIVPSTALIRSGSGKTQVARAGRDGEDATVLVDVAVIGELNGRSAIEPSEGGMIVEGDLVEVG